MERIPNNLSGIYFRYQNKDTGKWENWCFEDLPEEKQIEFTATKSTEWLQSLALKLAKTLREVGDEFGIKTQSPVDDDY
jgi:hypothetical protein